MGEQDRSPWELHKVAQARNDPTYTDPATGFVVFTADALRERGRCCGSGCRHCPFAHDKVALTQRPERTTQPAWLTALEPGTNTLDVLFWSGGKDSLLALRALRASYSQGQAASGGNAQRDIVLLTTFDAQSRAVAHQDIPIQQIVRQAQHLELPLLGVPLHSDLSYVERIREALTLVPSAARLVFGDLHLEHIRQWREQAFQPLLDDYSLRLHFPLWHVSYARLLADLSASGVPCEVSAVDSKTLPNLRIGTPFDKRLIDSLPPTVDSFGEQGEFHTLAKVWATSPMLK